MNVIYELVSNYGDGETNLPNTLNHFRQWIKAFAFYIKYLKTTIKLNLNVWCEYFHCR